ncbi:MAG: DNA polymerase III subunit delta' [Steroidobacteraceae bacterium]
MSEDVVQPLPQPLCLPWHRELADRLATAHTSRRVPHGLLLHGAEGLGKRNFAMWLGSALLCERERATFAPCGECPACTLLRAGTHPDFQWIQPEEDKQQIAIDQIRVATQKLGQTSARHGWKIAVIEHAHQMTTGAANSLLKTLEEPTGNSLLILLTSQPGALPATIRSRCQQLRVSTPMPDAVKQWCLDTAGVQLEPPLLEFCSGAPLSALAYAQSGRFDDLNDRMLRAVGDLLTGAADVTQIASAWADESLAERLKWLDLWLSQRLRAWIAGNDELITFPRRAVPLPTGGAPLNITAVYEVLDRIRQLRAQLAKTALQRELAVESLLLSLLSALRPTNRNVA